MTILRGIFWFSVVAFLMPQAPAPRQGYDIAAMVRHAVVSELILVKGKLNHDNGVAAAPR
ncbi:MAG: hypothetical protein ACREHE_01470 [Rhizomicrobium sp.]